MISEYEARKLQRDLRTELDGTSGAVWKCAAGLLAVVVVTLVGLEIGLHPDSESTASRVALERKPAATAVREVADPGKHLERTTQRD